MRTYSNVSPLTLLYLQVILVDRARVHRTNDVARASREKVSFIPSGKGSESRLGLWFAHKCYFSTISLAPKCAKMPPPSPNHHHHRGSVYLNNVGCALLEQGAFEDALKTFRDAVSVMKTVCTSAIEAPKFGSSSLMVNLPQLIHQANQRLAFPQPCRVDDVAPPEQVYASTPTFGVIALEDYRTFEFDTHFLQHSNCTLLCPIRLGIIEDPLSTTRDPDLDSATMLFNLGSSYACLAKCQPLPSHRRKQLQEGAARMFKLSDSVLQHCQSRATECMMGSCGCLHEQHQ